LVVVGAAVVFTAVVALTGGSNADEPPIAGVECDRGEQTGYHIHTRLEIFIEGQRSDVPTNIGVKQGECLYWLHTHQPPDPPGLIHVEAPEDKNFTLGDFFAVWGQPLGSTELLDRTVGPGQEIRATVGTAPFEGNPADIPLQDGDLIRLELGPPFQESES
jgi:hypothetical protein